MDNNYDQFPSEEPKSLENSKSSGIISTEIRRFSKNKVGYLVLLAAFVALAYLSAFLFENIPLTIGFLKYEPKTIFLTLAGYFLGPVGAVISIVATTLLELATISQNGFLGWLMNMVQAFSFCLVAVLIYQFRRTFKGALIGIASGVIISTGVMLAWNILITPMQMKVPLEMVYEMMPTVFIPFNLLKNIFNAAFLLILYTPLYKALKQSGLLARIEQTTRDNTSKSKIPLYLISLFIALLMIGSAIIGFVFWPR